MRFGTQKLSSNNRNGVAMVATENFPFLIAVEICASFNLDFHRHIFALIQ